MPRAHWMTSQSAQFGHLLHWLNCLDSQLQTLKAFKTPHKNFVAWKEIKQQLNGQICSSPQLSIVYLATQSKGVSVRSMNKLVGQHYILCNFDLQTKTQADWGSFQVGSSYYGQQLEICFTEEISMKWSEVLPFLQCWQHINIQKDFNEF